MKKVLRSIAVSIVMCITVQSYIFSLNIKNDVKAESLIVTGDLNDDNCVDSTDLSILSLFLVGDMKLPLNTQILADVDRDEIDSICISKGPGSYTGVRRAIGFPFQSTPP